MANHKWRNMGKCMNLIGDAEIDPADYDEVGTRKGKRNGKPITIQVLRNRKTKQLSEGWFYD